MKKMKFVKYQASLLEMAFLRIYQARMPEARFLIRTKSPCPPEEVGTGRWKGDSLLITLKL